MNQLIRIILGCLIACPLLAQNPEKTTPPYPNNTDSLTIKRHFITTVIRKDNQRLPHDTLRSLLKPTSGALKAYQWGNILKPVGPVLIAASIAVSYLGIKGEQKTAFIRGVGTKVNPNPDDVEVTYVKRSTPKVLAGLGLFVLGLYFIERSNELTATSVRLYNAKPAPIRMLSRIETVTFGITSTGNFGLEAHF